MIKFNFSEIWPKIKHLFQAARLAAVVIPWTQLRSLPSIQTWLSLDEDIRKDKVKIEAIYGEEPDGEEDEESPYVAHKRMRMPYHWIPNVSNFEVELQGMDWLFALVGMKRRHPNHVKATNWCNGGANRYLFRTFQAMYKAREAGNMEHYWYLGRKLLKSKAYRMSAFNYVLKNWHRKLRMKEVSKIWNEVETLSQELAYTIDFKRVYIPKANNIDWRPLGVPTKAWRVYLHMVNNLIVWSRIGKEGSQHAYTPQRGVHTAWSEVLDNVNKWDYIYEIDLKGFFDHVSLEYIRTRLEEEYRYPAWVGEYLSKLNRSIVKLTSEDKIPEADRLLRYGADLSPNPNAPASIYDSYFWISMLGGGKFKTRGTDSFLLPRSSIDRGGKPVEVEPLDSFLSKFEEDETKPNTKLDPILDLYDSRGELLVPAYLTGLEALDQTGKGGWKENGVPQGAATSTSLATLANESLACLRTIITPEGKTFRMLIIFYADDGIVFSDSPKCTEYISNSKAGVEVNQSKSGWLKYNGEWKVPSFKFLGLKYTPAKSIEGGFNEGVKRLITKWRSNTYPLSSDPAEVQSKLQDVRNLISELVGTIWGPQIEASTRKGATLRFSATHQFVAWLYAAREKILYGGSAAHLNNRVPLSTRDWIREELDKFLSLTDPTRILFWRSSGIFLNRLYCNAWNLSLTQNFSLSPRRGSWVAEKGAEYVYRYGVFVVPKRYAREKPNKKGEAKPSDGPPEMELTRVAIAHLLKQTRQGNLPAPLRIPRIQREAKEEASSTENSAKRAEYFKKKSTYEETNKMYQRIKGLFKEMVDRLPPQYSSEAIWGYHIGGMDGIPLPPTPPTPPKDKPNFESSPTQEEEEWVYIPFIKRLNVFNASSFACESLLSGHAFEKRLIRYYIKRSSKPKRKHQTKRTKAC